MKKIHNIAYILVLIGAVQWGIIGLFSINIIEMIFDSVPMITQLIYVLVGLSGLYLILFVNKKKSSCCEDECACTTCKTDTLGNDLNAPTTNATIKSEATTEESKEKTKTN